MSSKFSFHCFSHAVTFTNASCNFCNRLFCLLIVWFFSTFQEATVPFPAWNRWPIILALVPSWMVGISTLPCLAKERWSIHLFFGRWRLHSFAHSLRHNSQFFGLFQPVESVRTRFHCLRLRAPTFWFPSSSKIGIRIPHRLGSFLSCHQFGWDGLMTICPELSLSKSQSFTSLFPHEWSLLKGRMVSRR
jgi:hypothetical protein